MPGEQQRFDGRDLGAAAIHLTPPLSFALR